MPSASPLEHERNVEVGELADGGHGASHGRRYRLVGDSFEDDLAALQRRAIAGAFTQRDGDVLGLEHDGTERGSRDQGIVRLDELVDGAAGHLQGLGGGARHDPQRLV